MATEPADSTLSELNRRLAEIDAALDGEARQPSPEQYALLLERDQLRVEAASYWSSRDTSRKTADLEAELRELQRRRTSEISSRTGFVTSKGGNNHGPTPGAWVKLAAQVWAASDIGRLSSRIGQVESELERRRAEEESGLRGADGS